MGWRSLILDYGPSLTPSRLLQDLIHGLKFHNMNAATSRSQSQAGGGDMGRVLLAVLLYGNILITVLGNALVLFVIRREKALHTAFNYLVVNLALTDLSLSLTAMPLAAYGIITGYWPLAYSVCTTWLLINKILTFVSVYTIVAISADRLWSVKWSFSYRTSNKKRKTSIVLTCIWVTSLVLWVPYTVVDRIISQLPAHMCIYNSSDHLVFYLLAAIFRNHLPCVVLILLYLVLYRELRRRALIASTRAKQETSGYETSVRVAPSDTGTDTALMTGSSIRGPPIDEQVVSDGLPSETFLSGSSPWHSGTPLASVPTGKTEHPEDGCSLMEESNYQQPFPPRTDLRVDTRQAKRVSIQSRSLNQVYSNRLPHTSQSVSAHSINQPRKSQSTSVYSSRTPNRSQSISVNSSKSLHKSQSVHHGRPVSTKPHLDRRKYRKEMRVFSTMTLIVAGYLVCWLPHHIVFDLNTFQPGLVSEAWAMITVWLPYVNSTINPFLYNFSNPIFRRAFKNTFIRRK